MVCHCLQLSWQSAIVCSCCDTKSLKTSPNVIFMEKYSPKKRMNNNCNNLQQKPVLTKFLNNEEENFGKKTNAH